jgi:CO/xanthine dehydrogenase Mo-binding subunit/aerobic-type carbon monoxide dehydrogenase small subunit (CoxS/CutS family)
MDMRHPTTAFTVNGQAVEVHGPETARLSQVLRERLGLTGTKVGCDAGDCGACTVLLEGEPACACMVAVGQVDGQQVRTIEGLTKDSAITHRLQDAFLRHGAAQCGICTPGMVVAATSLLERNHAPSEAEALDAIGGVLCRCTGYRKIVAAIVSLSHEADRGTHTSPVPPVGQRGPNSVPSRHPPPKQDHPYRAHALHGLGGRPAGGAVGARIARLDGRRKVEGTDIFGADEAPADCLLLRAVRSPHDRARFAFGDLAGYVMEHPGLLRVFTARDMPSKELYGVIPAFADQTMFARGESRFRGEAVAAVVGDPAAIEALDLDKFPVSWEPLPALRDIDAAVAEGADLVHANRPGNILTSGRVIKGDVDAALARCDMVVEGEFETGFVEHAYIEPEAGFARRVGDRLELQVCTQGPYMNRDDIAKVMAMPPEAVRILPSAVGGGFGSKLDLSVQPFVALAAWLTRRPVRMVYTRPESMMTTTKRHPSRIRMRVGAMRDGRLRAIDFAGDFNTGAYSSWGPTVANRVPVHASGPYYVPHYRALTRAIHTHLVPAGAFRGFGVPQTTLAQEQLFDDLADRLGIDRLEFRIANALRPDQPTVTGQVLGEGVGIRACLEALRPRWREARKEIGRFNGSGGRVRRGVGVAGMWYGCGNTALPNPSTIRLGLKRDGRLSLHQGAVDIGQGSNTVVTQICADALGAPIDRFDLVSADTDLTPDCGKTSASRQTFVTGKAAELAGRQLRAAILRAANAGDGARVEFGDGQVVVRDGERERRLVLAEMPADARGYVLAAEETFNPPTTPLDADGQGVPYAVYGFGAQLAEIEVDMELGTVKVRNIVAAHDVGRAINPTLVEGQIEGGVAQGLGMALMEEFTPGRGENLHDYLIPTSGDMPPVTSILIEEASPVGPFGAKGIGEQALIPTAPAILNAIRDAIGARIRRVPATPDRVRAAILGRGAQP